MHSPPREQFQSLVHGPPPCAGIQGAAVVSRPGMVQVSLARPMSCVQENFVMLSAIYRYPALVLNVYNYGNYAHTLRIFVS